MGAGLTRTLADLRKRRLQTGLVALITLLACAMATTSLTLLVRSTAPFDDAFAAAHGAHLTFHLDARKVTPEQLRATTRLPQVTEAGEPFPMTYVPIALRDQKASLQLVGRDSPDGRVGRVQLVDGRWGQGPGENVGTKLPSVDDQRLADIGVRGKVFEQMRLQPEQISRPLRIRHPRQLKVFGLRIQEEKPSTFAEAGVGLVDFACGTRHVHVLLEDQHQEHDIHALLVEILHMIMADGRLRHHFWRCGFVPVDASLVVACAVPRIYPRHRSRRGCSQFVQNPAGACGP